MSDAKPVPCCALTIYECPYDTESMGNVYLVPIQHMRDAVPWRLRSQGSEATVDAVVQRFTDKIDNSDVDYIVGHGLDCSAFEIAPGSANQILYDLRSMQVADIAVNPATHCVVYIATASYSCRHP
jgi:hypothetical protein